MAPREKRERLVSPNGQAFTIVDRGRRGYQLECSLHGDRLRLGLDAGSRDDARHEAIATVERLVREAAVVGTPTLLKVASAMLLHKEKIEKKADSYLEKMSSHLVQYVLPFFGTDTAVRAVAAEDLRAFKRRLIHPSLKLSPKTANRILTTARQVFKYAEEAGYCPAPALPKNYTELSWEAVERWNLLTPVEIAAIIERVPPEIVPVIAYIANTGLRIGSALATQLSWIDSASKRVHYPPSAMKRRRALTVELNDGAVEALEAGLKLYPRQPFPFSYWYVRDRWLAATTAVGFPKLHIHDLRHSWVSAQLNAGTPLHVVRDMASHKSVVTTQLYAHSTDEARRVAADRVRVVVSIPADTQIDTRVLRAMRERLEKTVGDDGVEPSAKGLRIPCSTN